MLVHRRILDRLVSNEGTTLSDDWAAESLSEKVEEFMIRLVSLLTVDSNTASDSFEEGILSEEMLMKDLEDLQESAGSRVLDAELLRVYRDSLS